MVFKKLVSGIASLAIAGSMFAGLAVTASAATSVYTLPAITDGEYQGDNITTALGTGWSYKNATSSNVTANVKVTAASNALSINSGVSNNNSGYIGYISDTQENMTGKIYSYRFNYKTTTGTGTGNNASSLATVAETTAGYYGVFKTSISAGSEGLGLTDTSATNAVEIVIDNVNKKVVYYVGDTAKSTKDISDVNTGIEFRPGKNKTDTVSDFNVYELTMPTIKLDAESANPSVGGTATVNATVSNADGGVTITSSKDSVATGSYSDGVITVNGVAEGAATLTVTAKGTDVYETTTATIDVTVGDIKTGTVTVNYYEMADGATTTTKVQEPFKTEKLTVGTELTESDLNTVKNTEAKRYTLNTKYSQSLPYTVVEGEQTINLYYDVTEPITYAIYAVDSDGDKIKAAALSSGSGFVDDSVTYYYPAYVTGDDGKLYKSDSDTYGVTTTLSDSDTSINVKYTVQDASVFQYVEYDGNSSIYGGAEKCSNGQMKSGVSYSGILGTLTVAEKGVYSVYFGVGKTTENAYAKNGSWNINGSDSETLTFTQTPSEKLYENITLAANDVINVVPGDGKCALDYILIIKTGDAAPTSTITAVSFSSENTDDYVIDNGVLTYNGDTYYGYKAELSGYGDGKIVGTFVKKDDASAVATIAGDTTISGDSDTVVYIISNAEIDTDASSVTIE